MQRQPVVRPLGLVIKREGGARGTKPGGRPWRVGFRDPSKGDDASLASIELTDAVMAVSGDYERYFEQDGVRYGHRAADVKQLAELYVRSRSEGFGQEVKRRILLGTYVLSSGYYDAYFRKAAQVRRLIRDEYLAALEQCDALLAPVSPVTAWEMGCHSADPLQMYLMDAYTLSLNLAGLPGLSLPVGMAAESRMPVGMQLIGKAFDEAGLFRLGAGLEAALSGIGLAQL